MQVYGRDVTSPSFGQSDDDAATRHSKSGSSDSLYIIRTSDRKTFKECRQQWNFTSKIRSNWEPDVEGKALRFGTAIHAALETWYEPKTWHLRATEAMRAVAIASFLEHWPKPDMGVDEWEVDKQLGIAMLEGYFDRSIAKDDFTPVYCEIEFEVPVIYSDDPFFLPVEFSVDDMGRQELYFRHKPVVYQGRIDLIVEDKYGKYWIWDHKTASNFGSTDHLEMDSQCGSYMWAIQQMLGIRVEGVCYNELRKDAPHPPKVLKNGSLSKAKDQNTTYELYLQAIDDNGLERADYVEFLRFLKDQGTKFYRRTQVHRSQDELRVLGETIALEAIDMLNNPSIYPNPSKTTCNFCAFKVPCLTVMEGSDPTWALEASYHIRQK